MRSNASLQICDTALTAEADALLHHLARYRLSVMTAVERLPEFVSWRTRRIKAVLRTCERQSLIRASWLHQGVRCWCLAPAGAAHCGLPAERSGKLSESAKLRAFSLLQFCCLGSEPRRRLSTAELIHAFPHLPSTGLPNGYYFDPAGAGQLGLARLDAHRQGRWDRSLQALREDIDRHWQQPDFRRLIQAGRFEITLLTVFPEKASRLTAALAEHRDAGRIPVRCLALPELLPLITSLPRKEVLRHSRP
ncbi:MAG: hypothetical protein H0T47_07235 [Planctomycetaceae bacterium]|nr:hypothetical protein [Planctomycetaceae bacterium]